MEELYVEGLATHGGPELCVDDPRGRGEALAGHVQAGLLSREITSIGAPTLCRRWKATSPAASCASRWRAPRGRRTRACTEPTCARTGRARARPPAWSAGGPPRERQWR